MCGFGHRHSEPSTDTQEFVPCSGVYVHYHMCRHDMHSGIYHTILYIHLHLWADSTLRYMHRLGHTDTLGYLHNVYVYTLGI